MEDEKEVSLKEIRVRKITKLYYSRPDVQKALFEFSKNREISPRFFEGFGKRPDSFQYPGDIFEYVKKGATSFHCSEELWKDPLEIKTGMSAEEANNLRIGWDLLIDIDSKYIDYSKVSAQILLEVLKFHGIKNVGIKFSGSKGFHLIVPWKAIPKEVNGVEAKNMFPEWARILSLYITEKTKPQLIKRITALMNPNSKYIRDFQAPKEVMPDIILVSPRHLFRMPYSLHEKTALASIVLKPEEIEKFQLKDAEPLTMKVREYMPDCKEGEAKELLMQALDWWKDHNQKKESERAYSEKKDFKPIQITNISKDNFPPCIKKILDGSMGDGKKRSVFVLINFLRSTGLDRIELEKMIYEWNKKNNPNLKEGYIGTQLSWAYNKKSILPPNCKEFYQGIGCCLPDSFCAKVKNPVNYFIRKSLMGENKPKTRKRIN